MQNKLRFIPNFPSCRAVSCLKSVATVVTHLSTSTRVAQAVSQQRWTPEWSGSHGIRSQLSYFMVWVFEKLQPVTSYTNFDQSVTSFSDKRFG